MFVAWVLFPLVLLAICAGCGLLVDFAAGSSLPGPLVAPVGLALVIVATTLTTSTAGTSGFSTAVVVVLALAGYAVRWRRLRGLRTATWAIGIGLGIFACCAAPVVLSGNATFLGYFVLNDSAIHFALADRVLAHGPYYAGLPFSSYSQMLFEYLGNAYPTGADVALGAVRPLVAQDIAWVFQPYLAVVMALSGVSLYELLRGVVRSRPLRALCAFIAAQTGLVYAFYLEASVKEIVVIMLITVTVAFVFTTLKQLRPRGTIPLLLVAFAGLDVYDVAVVPWLGPPLGIFVLTGAWQSRHAIRRVERRRLAFEVAAGLIVLAVLAAPLIGKVSKFVSTATAVLLPANNLANLAAPLPGWQVLGIWPSGDFRFPVEVHYRITYALLGLAFASAIFGTIWMIRTRALPPLLLLLGDAMACVYLISRGSPYTNAKVMMLLSVSIVLSAMLGAAALHQTGRRLEGWALAIALAAGVMWTNVLGYRYASVAPRSQLSELATIGKRFSGQGPSFFNLSNEFAIHFLRTEAPILAYWTPVAPRKGLSPRSSFQARRLPWDPNDLALSYVEHFRLLVLGRSPTVSRPPANFTLAYPGRYYEVWRRTSRPRVLRHISFGGVLNPAAVPSCKTITAVAATAAREHAALAYVPRAPLPTLVPSRLSHPADWVPVNGDPNELIPRQGPVEVTGLIAVRKAGHYQVWLDGSIGQRFVIWVGRKYVGSISNELGPPGQWNLIGAVTTGAGKQPVLLRRSPTGSSPGADDSNPNNRLLGPLMLVPDGKQPTIKVISPRQARSLCGRSVNWIEVIK